MHPRAPGENTAMKVTIIHNTETELFCYVAKNKGLLVIKRSYISPDELRNTFLNSVMFSAKTKEFHVGSSV